MASRMNPRTRVPLPPPAQLAGENMNSAANVSTPKSEKTPHLQGRIPKNQNTGGRKTTRPLPNK